MTTNINRISVNFNQNICVENRSLAAENPSMSIGGRIKQARERIGISQHDLAELIGASQSAVGNWEAEINDPGRNRIPKIATALRVSPTWLEFGTDAPGVTEDSRDWDAHDEEQKPAIARDKDDWRKLLTASRFRRYVEPLVQDMIGEKVALQISDDDYAEELLEFFDYADEELHDEPDADVSRVLAQSLLITLARFATGLVPDQKFHAAHWRRRTLQTAELLLAPAPNPVRRARTRT